MTHDDTHAQVWAQIPWLVNGTASSAVVEVAQAHCLSCADCRQEWARQRHLAALLQAQASGPGPDVEQGWSALTARLDADAQDSDQRVTSAPSRWARWWGPLAAVEGLAVAALLLLMWRQPVPATEGYQTLSSTVHEPPVVQWRTLVDEQLSLGQWQSVLQKQGLQVVSGPSVGGVWGLAPQGGAAEDPETVAQQLRQQRGVRFVEVVPRAAQ